jgi:hypothetical protein
MKLFCKPKRFCVSACLLASPSLIYRFINFEQKIEIDFNLIEFAGCCC